MAYSLRERFYSLSMSTERRMTSTRHSCVPPRSSTLPVSLERWPFEWARLRLCYTVGVTSIEWLWSKTASASARLTHAGLMAAVNCSHDEHLFSQQYCG